MNQQAYIFPIIFYHPVKNKTRCLSGGTNVSTNKMLTKPAKPQNISHSKYFTLVAYIAHY